MARDGTTGLKGLQRSDSPGLKVITLNRESCQEHYITSVPQRAESLESLLQRASAAAREGNAQVLSQEVFCMSDKDKTNPPPRTNNGPEPSLGSSHGPVTWLENKHDANLCGTHLWAISGTDVKQLEVDGRTVGSVFEDGRAQYCRLGGLLPEDASRSRSEQAAGMFEQMEALLQANGIEFGHVLRTWFYNYNILDWYDDFNEVRNGFFRKKRVFEGLVPASTGVGGHNTAGTALAAGLLAVRAMGKDVRAFAVASPLQFPALEYGSSFSRAVELDLPDHRRLYVSGTASIDSSGKTVHVGDPAGQVKLTMEVVHAILESRGMDWANVVRSLAYFKHAKDAPIFEEYRTVNGVPKFPVVVVENDICRDELLFEIEVDVIRMEGSSHNRRFGRNEMFSWLISGYLYNQKATSRHYAIDYPSVGCSGFLNSRKIETMAGNTRNRYGFSL